MKDQFPRSLDIDLVVVHNLLHQKFNHQILENSDHLQYSIPEVYAFEMAASLIESLLCILCIEYEQT